MSRYYDSSKTFRSRAMREDVDPMSSMGNIGDVMLVFACGLMVALVVAWNVDLSRFQQVETDQELSKDDVTEMTEKLYGEGNAFVEMGTVYQDPATGKYYLVEEDKGSSSDSQGSSGSQGSSNSQGGE